MSLVQDKIAQLKEKSAREHIKRLRQVVDKQAEDEGLWFVAQTAPEAYLQQALRLLHDAIEEGR